MQDLGNTQYFKVETEPETGVKLVLSTVYEALTEKGYNPVNQIVGYIMSGDPTYITSHKNARSLKQAQSISRNYTHQQDIKWDEKYGDREIKLVFICRWVWLAG